MAELMSFMRGTKATMLHLMYGSGLRYRECRCLRIKDVCFDTGHIVVRNGKGQEDRVRVLPEFVVELLQRCIETAKSIHRDDLHLLEDWGGTDYHSSCIKIGQSGSQSAFQGTVVRGNTVLQLPRRRSDEQPRRQPQPLRFAGGIAIVRNDVEIVFLPRSCGGHSVGVYDRDRRRGVRPNP